MTAICVKNMTKNKDPYGLYWYPPVGDVVVVVLKMVEFDVQFTEPRGHPFGLKILDNVSSVGAGQTLVSGLPNCMDRSGWLPMVTILPMAMMTRSVRWLWKRSASQPQNGPAMSDPMFLNKKRKLLIFLTK